MREVTPYLTANSFGLLYGCEIVRATVDRHSRSVLIIVSKLGTVTLCTWEAGFREMALNAGQVMFCPPCKT